MIVWKRGFILDWKVSVLLQKQASYFAEKSVFYSKKGIFYKWENKNGYQFFLWVREPGQKLIGSVFVNFTRRTFSWQDKSEPVRTWWLCSYLSQTQLICCFFYPSSPHFWKTMCITITPLLHKQIITECIAWISWTSRNVCYNSGFQDWDVNLMFCRRYIWHWQSISAWNSVSGNIL